MLEKNLQKYFNFSKFRAGQKEVAESNPKQKDLTSKLGMNFLVNQMNIGRKSFGGIIKTSGDFLSADFFKF